MEINSMIYNSTGKTCEVLPVDSPSGFAYITSGNGTTRTFSLANHPNRAWLTADMFYVYLQCWTYSGGGSGVCAITYSYNQSTYVLTMTLGANKLHTTELSFDRANWKLIIMY